MSLPREAHAWEDFLVLRGLSALFSHFCPKDLNCFYRGRGHHGLRYGSGVPFASLPRVLPWAEPRGILWYYGVGGGLWTPWNT